MLYGTRCGAKDGCLAFPSTSPPSWLKISRMFALTTPNAALEGSRHSVGHSVSNGSSYSCSRPPTVHHCTPASCSELSPTRSSRKSFRRLPTPPIYVSASPSISTPPLPMPSSSTSSPSLSPPQRPPPRSRSVFVLRGLVVPLTLSIILIQFPPSSSKNTKSCNRSC